jgi:cysteine desulfurase
VAHYITSVSEHSSVGGNFRALEREGFGVTFLEVDKEGRVDLEQLKRPLTQETRLLSIMAANNETGVIQPLAEIAALAREKGALFHTDAVQALGKMPLLLQEWQPDLLSFSAHKFHGPRGAGGLLIKKGTSLLPLILGGGQEGGLRSGTENIPAVMGMARALEDALLNLDEKTNRLFALRNYLEKSLLDQIPGAFIHSGSAPRLCNTTSIGFEGVNAKGLVQQLAEKGIYAATQAACGSSGGPSRVLLAQGIPLPLVLGTLRFSLGQSNFQAQLDRVVEELVSLIAKERQRSWLWQKRNKENLL